MDSSTFPETREVANGNEFVTLRQFNANDWDKFADWIMKISRCKPPVTLDMIQSWMLSPKGMKQIIRQASDEVLSHDAAGFVLGSLNQAGELVTWISATSDDEVEDGGSGADPSIPEGQSA